MSTVMDREKVLETLRNGRDDLKRFIARATSAAERASLKRTLNRVERELRAWEEEVDE